MKEVERQWVCISASIVYLILEHISKYVYACMLVCVEAKLRLFANESAPVHPSLTWLKMMISVTYGNLQVHHLLTCTPLRLSSTWSQCQWAKLDWNTPTSLLHQYLFLMGWGTCAVKYAVRHWKHVVSGLPKVAPPWKCVGILNCWMRGLWVEDLQLVPT